ncbi:MAG TPA: hypothetical protein VNM37_24840 [Candidatus Dormibacteraeota bacterium]|nr:hypothetical protein [Candidatus Dormibacteraeota bacterium]
MGRHGTTRFSRDKIATPHAALEAEWYARLRDSGFDDIEPYNNPMNTRLVQHWHSTMQATKKGVWTGGAEMFRLLYEWLDETRYRVRGDRFLLAARCEGFDWTELQQRFGVDVRKVRLKCLKQARHMLRARGLYKRFR